MEEKVLNTCTHEEFVELVKEARPYYTVLSEYKGKKEKVLVRCSKCGDERWLTPLTLITPRQCVKCMPRVHKRMSHKDYINHLHNILSNISLLEPYKGNGKKHRYKCDCGNIFCTTPSQLEKSYQRGACGCPVCSKKQADERQTFTHEDFVKDMARLHPTIKVIGQYVNRQTPIELECLIDGNRWFAAPGDSLKGRGCRVCDGRKKHEEFSKSHEQFVEELKEINPNWEVIGDYGNSYTPVKVKCRLCGEEFEIKPSALLQGRHCPNCQPKTSRGEILVADILDEMKIEYEQQKTFDDLIYKGHLFFDFFLPKYNTVIEYDGEQHYVAKEFFGGQEGLESTQKRDEFKNEYCSVKNIHILRIPFTEDTREKVLHHIEKFFAGIGVYIGGF